MSDKTTQEVEETKKTYPTPENPEGYFFANETEEESGIETKNYPNGSAVKRFHLQDGREVVVRKLRGADFVETKKRMQASGNSLDMDSVNMSVATTIAGEKMPPEFYLNDLFQVDYVTIAAVNASLNFQ